MEADTKGHLGYAKKMRELMAVVVGTTNDGIYQEHMGKVLKLPLSQFPELQATVEQQFDETLAIAHRRFLHAINELPPLDRRVFAAKEKRFTPRKFMQFMSDGNTDMALILVPFLGFAQAHFMLMSKTYPESEDCYMYFDLLVAMQAKFLLIKKMGGIVHKLQYLQQHKDLSDRHILHIGQQVGILREAHPSHPIVQILSSISVAYKQLIKQQEIMLLGENSG